MTEKEIKKQRAWRLIKLFAVFLSVYIGLKYFSGIVVPLAVAFFAGSAVARLARKSEEKFFGKRHYWAIFYLSAFCFLSAVGIAFLAERGITEIKDFFNYVFENSDRIVQKLKKIFDFVSSIPSKLPFFNTLFKSSSLEGFSSQLASLLGSVAREGSAAVAEAVGKAVAATPGVLLSTLVCIIASVYISVDYDRIRTYFLSLMTKAEGENAVSVYRRVYGGLVEYIKVYFKIFLLTFAELYAGLLILKREYAFVIALLLAILDILPLFGAPAVLLIWGAVLLIGGELYAGIGMLVLFGIMTVVRQVIEPRLVGKGFGLHPLASLVSMFAGLKLFGLVGVVAAPILLVMAKEILEDGRENSEYVENNMK